MGHTPQNRTTSSDDRSVSADSGPSTLPGENGGIGVEDLLWVFPRFVERTSKQVELARVLAGHLPCVGSLISSGGTRASRSGRHGPVSGEPTDVLEVLAETPATAGESSDGRSESADPARGEADSSAAPSPVEPLLEETGTEPEQAPTTPQRPTEGDLAVSGYDSLAASQVVPRLATLAKDDLSLILAYEQSHRNRQTIVHRVLQLLDQ